MSLGVERFDVLVVGGGVSGLFAAQQLLLGGLLLRVVLLESSGRVGGRLAQLEGMVDWPIELGGEFIHGVNTTTHDLIKSQGFPLISVFDQPRSFAIYLNQFNTLHYADDLGNSSSSSSENDSHHGLSILFNIVNELYGGAMSRGGGGQMPESVKSLRDYLVWRGLGTTLLSVADAWIANVWGTGIDKLGVDLLSKELKKTNAIGSPQPSFRMKHSTKQLVDHLSSKLDIRYNQTVKDVIYNGDNHDLPIKVITTEGKEFYCKKLLVTVPIDKLKDIRFKSSRFSDHQLFSQLYKSVGNIKMGKAMKVFVRFRLAVWPEQLQFMVCAGCLIPQVWFDGAPIRGDTDQHLACGFIGGDLADQLGNENVIRVFLEQLDRMFARSDSKTYYVSHHIQPWPVAYSYPSIQQDSSVNPFESLSKINIGDSIFFAGEATAFEQESSSINGAIETGNRAQRLILQSFK